MTALTKVYLEQFKFTRCEIIQQSDKSLLILVFFNNMNVASKFYNVLKINPFTFNVKKPKKDSSKFEINFSESNQIFALHTKKTSLNYDTLKLLFNQDQKVFITTGKELMKGMHTKVKKLILIEQILFLN